MIFTVEYRDLLAGERVLLETDSRGEAEFKLAECRNVDWMILVDTNIV